MKQIVVHDTWRARDADVRGRCRCRSRVRGRRWSRSPPAASTSSTSISGPASTRPSRRPPSAARRPARSSASAARSPRSSLATASPTRWFAARTPSTPSCPARKLVPVPDGVTFDAAAAVMLQGTTAHYLTRSTFPLDIAHTCLVHAAAGGLGSAARADGQGARRAGDRHRLDGREGTRSSASLGADETILYTEQDFETEVRRLTDGRGVDVVYDSVGKTTFDKSLKRASAARHDGAVRPVERPGRAARPGDRSTSAARCS